MTAPVQARVIVLEKTSQEHTRELETLREVDKALLGVVERAIDKVHQFQTDVNQRFDLVDARFDGMEHLLRDILRRLPEPAESAG